MDTSFSFDDGSDNEEIEFDKAEDTQSPWEFTAYSESVGEEHFRRNTTSIDAKISKALQECPVSLPDDNVSDESESESEIEEEEDGDEEEVVVSAKSRKKENRNHGEDSTANGSEKANFFASSEGAKFHANSFIDLKLSRSLLRACEALGYHNPTPIQAACIPLALAGRDISGSALTGSGKTAAFTLPVLERLLYRPKRVKAIRVLILTPTRELAAQVHSMIEKLAQFTDIRSCLILGGFSTKEQESALKTLPDIVVATPGRIVDILRNSLSISLDDLGILILDEADRLLEVAFSGEIRELIRLCPKKRQTMLFSATMTEKVDELINLSLTEPVRLQADPSTKRPTSLTEEFIRLRRMGDVNQEAVLLSICSKTFTKKVIIFSGTKAAAHRLKIIFGLAGFTAAELHGNLTQTQRLDALELFRRQEVDFLIATDVAARGLDIVGVQTVINFAFPRDITSYVHRVGRTARAGRDGYAVTFVPDNDRSLLKAIAKKAGSQLKERKIKKQPIMAWSKAIEEMEDQISSVLRDECNERILRKAEMEATKALNFIEHKDEIFSRPKRTWFSTEKEKKSVASAAKEASLGGNKPTGKKFISAEQADELKMKEKRRREREKSLPRKKRRRLEAKREMMEEDDEGQEKSRGRSKEKSGKSLMEVGYQRAKAMKSSVKKKGESIGKGQKKSNSATKGSKNNSKKEEMLELFQTDMNGSKQGRFSKRGIQSEVKKKPKNSFKSKARYNRRK
ncbi:DEAD-box ATP-dependent RNA helicase 28 [Zostera marina]|uniref:DEAD-box ATP-dependent RNA helicase 28 n=1 Tax=Zostera marina TaxID=29655 RepID=A0A0K9NN19_ZOSMR|nr:DEAD-box ATP-dependent RNA helicase 28 [Zostera marina]